MNMLQIEKNPCTSGLDTTTVLNTNIWEVEKKMSWLKNKVTTPEFYKLTAENFSKLI